MIFQSMPATAMAAEDAVAVEKSVEDSTDEQTATEAAEPANEQGDSEAEPSQEEPAEDSETPASTEESKEDDQVVASTEETKEDSETPASTEETKEDSETPAASTEGETKEDNETSVSTEEPSQDATVPETTEVAEESTTTEEEMQEVGEDTAAKLETVIKIAEPSLPSYYFTLTQFEEDSYWFTSDYAPTSNFGEVKSQVEEAVTIEVDGEEKKALKDGAYLKFQYQAGTEKDGKIEYTDMTGLPTDAGKYRLKLSIDAVPELCGKAADKFVYFEIKKAELRLNLENLTDPKPGTAVSDFKKEIIDNYSVKSKNNNDYTNLTQLAAEDIKVYEVDKEGNKAETADTVFNKDKDYIVTLQVKFKDEAATGANYVIAAEDYYVINVGDFVEVTINVDLKKPVDVIKYDSSKELKLEDIQKEYIDVDSLTVTKTENGEEVSIFAEGTKISDIVKPAWYTREQLNDDEIEMPALDEETQFEADGYRYTQLKENENPKNAGEYCIVYVYPGEKGQYKKAYSNAVPVSIDPASLMITAKDVSLKVGMDATAVNKVLAEAGFALYNVNPDGTKGTEYDLKDKKAFFGILYTDSNKTQYFVPEFKLQQRTELDKDQQTETERWGKWVDYDRAEITKGTADKAVQYQIIPTGQKVVFNADGGAISKEPITNVTTNSAEKNYLVDVYEPFEVPIEEAEPTEVKVENIVKALEGATGSGLTVSDPATVIYNGLPLFDSREAYKQAEVTGANVSKTDPSITYTWEVVSKEAYDAYREVDEKEGDGAAKKEAEAILLDSFEEVANQTYDSLLISLVDAGFYRLRVDYKDASNKFQPSTGYAYFEIEPWMFITKAEKQYANYGDDIENTNTGSYSIWMLPGNDESQIDKAIQVPIDPEYAGLDAKKKVQRRDKDGTTWLDVTETTYMEGETYRVSYGFDNDKEGVFASLPLGEYTLELKWENLTNRKGYDQEKKEWTYYAQPSEILFDKRELEIAVNADSIASSKVYDAKPAFEQIPEGMQISIIDKETGETVQLTEEDQKQIYLYWKWQEYNNEEIAFEKAVYGGTYKLYVSFAGNDTYKAFDQPVKKADGSDFTYTIKKRDITIAPKLNETPVAGELANTLITSKEIVYENVPADDDDWFNYGVEGSKKYDWTKKETINYIGYRVLQGYREDSEDKKLERCEFNYTISQDNNSVSLGNDYLRANKEYLVKLNGTLVFPYSESYNVTWKPAVTTVTTRGTSEIFPVGVWSSEESNGRVALNWDAATRTVTPREGIPFVYSDYYEALEDIDEKTIPMDKNYIALQIKVPNEFIGNTSAEEFNNNFKNFVFENSIKAANGYVLGHGIDWNESKRYGYINVLFPVAMSSDGKTAGVPDQDGKINSNPQFNITWEDGYTEAFTLNLENAQLESNLKNAVSPKSLSFNGVQAKMAVGEEQQLDVKIAKAQLGDIVRINYRLAEGSPTDIISIDSQTGRVTALMAAKTAVTVEAYPVRLAKDGKTFEPIPQEKGVVKPAKAKITVTEVTAPAIKSAVAIDNSRASISYTVPDNGYRREIYVVETEKTQVKTWNADKFNEEIDSMKNGQWEGKFAIAPIYISGEKNYSNNYDAKKKLFTYNLSGLKTAGATYVVYVRNVSAERTLENGSKVVLSKAGTVKNFVTTLAKVQDVVPKFTVTETENDTKNPVKYYDVDEEGYIVPSNTMQYVDKTVKVDLEIPDTQIPIYLVDLFAKSAQVSVDGWFRELPSNPAADAEDYIKRQLPLKKLEDKAAMLASYVDPKLTYAVTDTNTRPKFVNNKWDLSSQSKFASINNSGKITFKGVDVNGVAGVYVWALADNGKANCCKLYIVAMPDTVTGKKAKMKVGDELRLATLLDYKFGKTKVPNYRSTKIEITNLDKAEEAGFALRQATGNESVNGEKCVEGEWIITAKAPTTANFDLQIVDKSTVDRDAENAEGAVEATVSLTTAQLDPVKGLKAVYVDDKHITLNFAHAGKPEAFDIEVKDARGSLIYKKLVNASQRTNVFQNYPEYMQKRQKSYDKELSSFYSKLLYFEKTKTFAFTIDTDRLIRLSAYTISVTPVYEGQKAAKAATAKTKTTNIPAAYWDVDVEDASGKGGATISYLSSSLREKPYFTSGNTYTLRINADANAQSRVTDTLTWKSSNTKVASIKANPGSYTATFKPVQQGITTISVTSKITKKVIARYDVMVKAVGNGKGFGGEYEWTDTDSFYSSILAKWDPFYQGKLETLTLKTSVTTETSGKTWVAFTAPVYGEYTFSGPRFRVFSSRNLETDNNENEYLTYRTLKLEANQKIYFCVQGSGELRVSSYTDFSRLTVENDKDHALNVPKTSWIAFTAPEDNYYVFKGTDITSTYMKDNTKYYWDDPYEISLKAGETIFIQVNQGTLYVEYKKAAATLTLEQPSVEVTLSKKEKTYVRFTAPASQEYTFETPANIGVNYYEAIGNTDLNNEDFVMMSKVTDGTEAAPQTKTLYIEEGATVLIELPTGNETKVTVKVTASAVKELTKEQTVTKNTKATLFFKIPETSNAKYAFNAPNALSLNYYNDQGEEINFNDDTLTIKDGESLGVWNPDNYKPIILKCGDVIYIKVDATGASEDVKVSVTTTDGGIILTDFVNLTLTNDFAESWYTFEAKSAGWYEVSALATKNDGKDTHRLMVKRVNAVLSDESYDYYSNMEISSNGTTDSAFVKLEAGDKVILKASADKVSDNTITTAAKISVNKVTITPLKLGENSVTLNAKDSVNYYSFTPTEHDRYTFTWTPAENTGSAEVKYGGDLGSITLSLSQDDLQGGWVRYISVKQTTDTTVSGTLKVSSNKTSAKVLANGVNEFNLKDGENITYKFTVPTDNVLGYKLTVANTATAGENAPKPSVRVDYDSVDPGETRVILKEDWSKADESKTISVSASGNVTGTIKVEPIEAAAFPADNNAKVTSTVPVWYQQKLTESGRYLFVSEDKETTTEFFYYENGRQSAVNAAYYKSGTVIYAKVSTTSKEEKTAVVKKPAKIATEALNLDTEVTVTEEKPYYEFEAPEYAEYTFVGADSIHYSVPKKNDTTIGPTVVLEKGQKVFITASKDAKLKVTKSANITKLEVGVESAEITLEKGQKAVFSYNIFAKGTYAFKTTSDKLNISGIYDNIVDKNSYKVKTFGRSFSDKFTVTNNTEEAVKFKVSVSEIEINELTEGTAARVTKKEANTDECVFFKFKATEDFRYVFSNTAKAPVDYKCVEGSLGSSLWSKAQWIEKYTEKDENEVVLAVSATEDYDLNVKKLQPTVVTITEEGVKVPFKAADIKWISFTAEKTGEYSFTFTSETTPTIYGYSTSMEGSGDYISGSTSYSISKGSSVYFEVEENADIELNVKVSLTSEAVEFKAASNPFDATEKVTKAYFTAAEAGVYTLKLALEEGSGSVRVETEFNSRSSSYLSTDLEYSYALAAGESIYFTPSSGTKGSITINKEASMKDITVGADMGIPAGKTWLRFVAPEDGKYQFTLSENIKAVNIYNTANVSGSGDEYTNTIFSVKCMEDNNIYLYLDTEKAIRINTTKVGEIIGNKLNLGDQEISFEDAKNKEVTFRAEADGFYIFKAQGANLSYLADKRSKTSVSCNENAQFFIMKGETVFLNVTGNSGVTATINVKKGDAIPSNVPELKVGDSVDASVEDGESRWFTFTAPKEGTYSFWSSDNEYQYEEDGEYYDMKASLYAGGCDRNNSYNEKIFYCDKIDDDTAGNMNFVITYYLKAGQKIYLESYQYGHNDYARCNVNVMSGVFVPDNMDEE